MSNDSTPINQDLTEPIGLAIVLMEDLGPQTYINISTLDELSSMYLAVKGFTAFMTGFERAEFGPGKIRGILQIPETLQYAVALDLNMRGSGFEDDPRLQKNRTGVVCLIATEEKLASIRKYYNETEQFLIGLQFKTLHIIIILLCIKIDNRVDLVGFILLQDVKIILEMVLQIKSTQPESPGFGDHQEVVVAGEFPQQSPPPVCIQPEHILIKPDLAAAQGGYSLLLHDDLVDRILCQDIAMGIPPLDRQFTEIHFKVQVADPGLGFEGYPDGFGFPVRIGAQVEDPGIFIAFGQVVFLVPCDPGDRTAFHHGISALAIPVNEVINGPGIILLEHGYVDDILTSKYLLVYLGHLERPIPADRQDIIDIRTVTNKLVFLQGSAEETFLPVDIQFLVGRNHFGRHDGIKTPDLCTSFPSFSVFLLYLLVIIDRERDDVCQMVFYFIYLFFNASDMFIRLERIIF